MAVMRNSIIFGGVDSADFGIYIGGEGTFNAPKRDVEMISIPGRNGAFALDKGRFENIEVTYSAFNFEPDLDTFSAQLEAFRNAICSQKGYQRLTDTFHPDEYRMAAYIDGLEIKPVNFNTASTFDIVFDCKPQRYLTSGEEPITIGEWHETETASGEIASFEAKEGDAVKSLVADIEPIQSLNGYDKPWSGGAGKNKLEISVTPYSANGCVISQEGDAIKIVANNATGYPFTKVGVLSSSFPSGSYYLKWTPTVTGMGFRIIDRTVSPVKEIPVNWDGAVTIPSGHNELSVEVAVTASQITDGTYTLKCGLMTENIDYQPYSNICPISGYDSVVVSRCGKNLLPPWTSLTLSGVTFDIASDGSIIANGENQTGYNEAIGTKTITLPAGTYTVSGGGSLPIRVEVFNVTQNKTYWEGGTKTFTYNGTDLLQAWIYVKKNVAMDNVVLRSQIEPGSSVSAYEPYQSYATYTTDLSGTRYGGTLDVVSGVLTVDRAMVTLNGTESNTWYLSNSSTRQTVYASPSLLPNVKTSGDYQQTAGCNSFGIILASSQIAIGTAYVDNGYFNMVFALNTFSASADVKTWLASNNVQLVYELATPTTVQLTAQEVELLVGLNQVWANSGDVSVEYGTAPNVLVNPTLFESSPMLEVEGYGSIGFNGYEIELNNETLGDVTVLDNSTYTTRSKSFIFPSVLYNSGDTITVKNALFRWIVTHNESSSYTLVDFVSASDSLASAKTRIVSRTPSAYSGHYETSYLSTAFESVTFTAGTTSTLTDNVSAVFAIYNQSNLQFVENTTVTATWTIKYEVYDAENDMITLTWTSTDTSRASAFIDSPSLYSGTVVASSSISMLGHPTYIDCDLGECYRIDDDEYISLNHKVDLGSDLPKLGEGANTITYDDTVTDLKVIPRWWRI